jgi:hypothetical protein
VKAWHRGHIKQPLHADSSNHFPPPIAFPVLQQVSHIMRLHNLAAVSLAGSLVALSSVQPTSAASVNGTESQLSAAKLSQSNQLGMFERGRGGRRTTSVAATPTRPATSTSIAKGSTTTTTVYPTDTGKPNVEKAVSAWYDAVKDPRHCDSQNDWKLKGNSLIETRNSTDPSSTWAYEVGDSVEELNNPPQCPDGQEDYKKDQEEAFSYVGSRMRANNTEVIS